MAAAEGVEEAEAPAAVEVVELQAGVAGVAVVAVGVGVAVEVVELQAVGVPEVLEEAVVAVERPPGEGQPAEPSSAPAESPCASVA